MTTTNAPRRTAVPVVLAMLLSLVTAVPALAADPTGSAELIQGADIVAGQQQVDFTIRVDYPQSSGLGSLLDPKDPVDVVQIVPPRNVILGLEGATEGWTSFRPSDSDRLFFHENTIAPGDTIDFSFTGDTVRPAEDLARSFKVLLSSDGGRNFTEATDDGLQTLIRVLKINAVEIVAPVGVTDGTASTEQDNVVIDVTVENFGDPAGTSRTGLMVDAGLQGVDNEGADDQFIPYHESRVFSFDATMPSSPTTLTPTGVAQATDGDAEALPVEGGDLEVVRRFTATYLSGTLSPTAVVPNSSPYTFEAGFDSTGDVLAQLDLTQSAFEMGGSFTTDLASPSSVGPSDDSFTASFEPAVVDLPDDDGYTPTVRFVGTDENDATIDISLTLGDTVKVDSDIPIVSPILEGVASNLDDPDAGEEEVAREGTELGFAGEVNNSDESDCTDCSIQDAFLRYTFANGNSRTVDVTDDISIDGNGNLSGSHVVDEASTAVRSVKLFVEAVDEAGNGDAPGASASLIVDNIAPTFSGGITGQLPDFVDGSADPDRTITVFLAESVRFPGLGTVGSDWYVDGTSVTDAQGYRDDGSSSEGHADAVVLTVSSDLDPNEVPEVRYEPGRGTSLDGNRGQDQVARDLADAVIQVVDGIAPDLADLLKVNDRIDQDGFWSNTTTPSLTVGDIAVGDTVRAYHVTEDGSTLIDQATQQNDSGQVTLNDDGSYAFNVVHDETVTIALEVLDAGSNSSGLAEFAITFDFVNPTVQQAIQSGREVTVTLTEPLSADPNYQGDDAASDWAAEAGEGFSAETFAATSVSHQAGDPDVTVTYEQSAADADLDRVIYEFLDQFGDKTRYEDRAGNVLENFTSDAGP